MANITGLDMSHFGKRAFVTGVRGMDIVSWLGQEVIKVNPTAQRSLAKAGDTQQTQDLLENSSIHRQPRMRQLLKFLRRIIQELQKTPYYREGFFGAPQWIIPEKFKNAKVRTLALNPSEVSMVPYMDALNPGTTISILSYESMMGEAAFHVADGQGRLFGIYAINFTANKAVLDAKKKLAKAEKEAVPLDEAKKELAEAEEFQAAVRKILSETTLPIVVYYKELQDGQVVGLDVEAERRCYVEGNALNSQASKEELLKFESFSPVILSLQEIKDELSWMQPEFIEDNSKTISRSSSRVFTLSALAQAYALSMTNKNDAIKALGEEGESAREAREDFVHAYWRKVSEVFETVWTRHADEDQPSKRLAYVRDRRERQDVRFQALFLLGLGALGYEMGTRANWAPNHLILSALDKLGTDDVNYYALRNPEAESVNDRYDMKWVSAIMKPTMDRDTGDTTGYVFNNVNDSQKKAFGLLAMLTGLRVSVANIVPEEPDVPSNTLPVSEEEEELVGSPQS